MTIAITGASGFIGRHLTQYFATKGDTIKPISRNMLHYTNMQQLQYTIDSSDVIINLAGESIDQIWTPTTKLNIVESRIITTRTIVEAINRSPSPKLLISASAVGIYPSTGCHDDSSRMRSRSFLGEVCRAWEHKAKHLDPCHSLTITRFGVVFAPVGGAFERMISTHRFGFMVRFGSGNKHLSWISIDDLTRAIDFIIHRDDMRGVVNLCAPEQTTQQMFIDTVSRHLNVHLKITLPDFFIRAIRGEAAELILQNQCTLSRRLFQSGFQFHSPTIDLFCSNIF